MFTAIQENLFDPETIERGGYRWNSPDTSVAAAKAVDCGRLLKLCLEAIASAPDGLTNDEIAERNPKLPLGSISPRSGQLRRKGLIEDSGKRRATRTGSMAIVWKVTEAGRRQVANESND